MKYNKPPLTILEQIDLLRNRKLIIEDEDRVCKYLSSVSYYRLSGYMFHLQDKENNSLFKDKTTFSDIINLYTFDKKLRCVFLEYLERIEVCFRTRLLNRYSSEFGFFWYLDDSHILDQGDIGIESREVLSYKKYVLDSLTKDFENPKEQFLRSFKKNYSNSFPPENMSFEILSFGKLIKLYTSLKNTIPKNDIANLFNLPSGKSLSNWLQFLNDVRNVCAHHSRLWNRKFTYNKLSFPSRKKYAIVGELNSYSGMNIYGAIIAINNLLKTFNETNSFINKVESLIEFHHIQESNLGFPPNWKEAAPWRLS